MKAALVAMPLLTAWLWPSTVARPQRTVQPPIIDMHVHAGLGDSATRRRTEALLARHNVRVAVLIGRTDSVLRWRESSSLTMIASLHIPLGEPLDMAWTRAQFGPGKYAAPTILPREAFHAYLEGLMKAGLGKRLMFGSDFTSQIDDAVAAIETAPFLTAEQRRDILYNNAARFLRLSDAQIRAHHGTPPR